MRFITTIGFTGLRNYRSIFSDPLVWNSIINGFVYTFGSLGGAVVLGLILAIILNEPLRGRNVFRGVILIPWIVTQIVSMTQLKWMLNYDYGLVNFALGIVGIRPIDFLADLDMAMATVIGSNIWRSMAYPMILILAGLQSIPPTLYEAAQIDGASFMQRIIFISLPLIKMPLLIICIILTISYFTLIIPILVLTAGGPAGSTETIALRMYNEAFVNFRLGIASSLGVVIFIINLALGLLYLKVLRSETVY